MLTWMAAHWTIPAMPGGCPGAERSWGHLAKWPHSFPRWPGHSVKMLIHSSMTEEEGERACSRRNTCKPQQVLTWVPRHLPHPAAQLKLDQDWTWMILSILRWACHKYLLLGAWIHVTLCNSIAALPTTNQPVPGTTLKNVLLSLQSSIHADIQHWGTNSKQTSSGRMTWNGLKPN